MNATPKQMSGFIYLAQPYTGQEEYSYSQALRALAWYLNQGHVVYSPIAHTHEVAKAHGLSLGWEFWRKQSLDMVEACAEVHVLQLPGWDRPVGVTAEVDYARSLGKPVWMIELDEVSEYAG